MSASEGQPAYTDAERNAMRAYLQRSEVRMSTLHRVATAFVGGAGLLILIPVFIRDIIEGIIEILLATAGLHFITQPAGIALMLTLTLYATAIYPFALSLLIPLYSLYLLLKDIIHFYYSIYAPGFPATLLHPTFSLSGISFSADESPNAKRAIMHYEYSRNMDFMLPFSEGKRELYFDQLIEATNGDIIPSSRKWDKLVADGMVPEGANRKDIERFDAALGVVRSLDRDLVEEVAVTEMHLARNVIYLRRLVLRYAKSLLLIVWTTIVTFMTLPFLRDGRFDTLLVLSLGYFIWSLMALLLLRWPIAWIYRHRREKIDYSKVDKQLIHLDDVVRPYLLGAIPVSVVAVFLALLDVISR
ncbi:hypothetical protein VZO05_00960 [Aggregatilineales bacterium SYSU G02658]